MDKQTTITAGVGCSMRVAMYYNNNDVRIEKLPIPKITENELLVKIIASGICGSDVMEWYRIKKAPRVLGHEISGIVTEVGKRVQKFKKGDRVFVSHHIPCYKCKYCLSGHHTLCETLRTTNFDPGGFSEYIRVPQINIKCKGVYVIPDKMTFEDATFIEPLACVMRGQRMANVQKGNTVIVIGSGISGLLHIQLAKLKGAKRIIATDVDEYRLKMAKKFGADVVINAKKNVPQILLKENNNNFADRVIICAGSVSAFVQGLQCVEKQGWILFFAPPEPGVQIPFPLFDLWNKDVTMVSTYAAVEQDFKESIEIIKNNKINVKDMITHILPLEQTLKGFQLVNNARKSIKVIIKP
ncbi:MAG: zinc-dependent dehydrogenase [bacterium]